MDLATTGSPAAAVALTASHTPHLTGRETAHYPNISQKGLLRLAGIEDSSSIGSAQAVATCWPTSRDGRDSRTPCFSSRPSYRRLVCG